jgi:ABC-2 type transport system permease protein
MDERAVELVLGPFRQSLRSLIGWGVGLGSLVAVTVAFWPAFEGSSGISDAIDQLPAGIVDAFGLADFGTPAGFLRGNLYEFVVPLLLAIAAVAVANGLTAAEEDSGRSETILSQPISRPAILIGRAAAMTLWLAVMTSGLLVVQLLSDAIVGLEIDAADVAATVSLCGALALFYGAVALAIAGWWPRPSIVLSISIAATVGGYLVSALLPLSDQLEPLSGLSPWKWALGGDPLAHGAEPLRYLALGLPAVALVVIAVIGFTRRDVRSA